MNVYTKSCLSHAQQDELIGLARAGITGPEAVALFPASHAVLARVVAANGLQFIRRQRVSDEQIVEALASGRGVFEVKVALRVHTDRVSAIRDAMGLPSYQESRAVRKREVAARCVALAPTHTVSQIAVEVGANVTTVRKYLEEVGVSPAQYVRPIAPGSVRRAPRPKTSARVPRSPKPAPIKRPKKKLPKSEPLFFTCTRKHPITPSNRVKGTEKECLVCRKRGVNLSPALAGARDAMIADLMLVIEREVAELTADLRPGMEKVA